MMREFEDLLDEVLREASNPEPSPDMSRRMMMGLSNAEPSVPRSTWIGVAAVVLIGLGLWPALVNRTARLKKELNVEVSKSDQRTGAEAREDRRSYKTPSVSLQSRTRPKLSGRRAAPIASLSETPRILVAPLTVDSISIKPLQIASLSPDRSLKERSTP